MSSAAASTWFCCLHKRKSPRVRLICFPWAGGGSTAYARWGANMPEDVEVHGVRLPGRESKREDEVITDIRKLADILSTEVYALVGDTPFAFFGHSMGIMVAYETAAAIREKHGIQPQHLFFSGSFAPHSQVRKMRFEDPNHKGVHNNSDEELLAWVASNGGTPAKVLDNDDYMRNHFLPAFRADLELAYKYYRPDAASRPFSCGVTFYDGDKDVEHHSHEFKALTTSTFEMCIFPGGHFYLLKEDNRKSLLENMTETILAKK